MKEVKESQKQKEVTHNSMVEQPNPQEEREFIHYFLLLALKVQLLLRIWKQHLKTYFLTKIKYRLHINPIEDGLFRGCSRMGGGEATLPKICRTYPTMMKLGTIIPYPKKIQKMYESRDTPLEFCWHKHFFTGIQQILLYQEIQI